MYSDQLKFDLFMRCNVTARPLDARLIGVCSSLFNISMLAPCSTKNLETSPQSSSQAKCLKNMLILSSK